MEQNNAWQGIVKRADIEILRILSAFGIVYFHAADLHFRDIAYSGLIIFTIISVYLVDANKKYNVTERISRLLLPYIFWAVLYGVLYYLANGRVFKLNYNFVQYLICSPSIHLWYLPFILMVTLIINKIKIRVGSVSWFLSLIMLISSPFWRSLLVPPPLAQYLHALPAVFVGLFYRDFYTIKKNIRIIQLVTIFFAIIYIVVINVSGVGVTYLVGITLSSVILIDKCPDFSSRIIFLASSSTFGIYLVHPLFLYLSHMLKIEGVYSVYFAFLVSMVFVLFVKRLIKIFDFLKILKNVF